MQASPELIRQFETRHFFAPGLYAREVFLPAGSCAIGKVHLKDHLCVVLGDLSIYSPAGVKRVDGYDTFNTAAGEQRTVYAHTDSWFTTFHANPGEERDLAKIEARNASDDFALLDHFPDELKTLGSQV